MPGSVATIILTAILAAQLPAPPPARVRTPAILPISAIAITGNKSIPTDAILAITALKPNDNGSAPIFDAARDRLLATGYFDLVSYSFKQQDLGFAITFNVTEMKQVYPVRAEALPLPQDQLIQILKSTDPLFNGLLPATAAVINRAAAAIEQSLAPANPGLHIRARVASIAPDRYEIQFTPAEGLPIIADVTFDGSAIVPAADLHLAMVENGIGQPFSESGIQTLLDRVIRPLFAKQGYMRARFTNITSKPAEKVKGVDVHVTVVDGPRYKVDSVSVRGQMANDTRRILRMANLPSLDQATYDDLIQGIPKVRDTLRGEGYLDAAVTTGYSLNDADKTISAWFDITPGEQYVFGHLDVIGLGLDGEAAIRKMWSVKPGDPFPASYQERFLKGVKAEELFDNLGDITATPTVNRQTHVVDVVLYFAAAPIGQPRRRAP